jgi:hypothetical protein
VTARPGRPDAGCPERGAGLIGTIAGVSVFLAFLLFAVQLLVNLYSATVVTSAAYDAARTLATTEGQPPSVADVANAESFGRSLLGGRGDEADFQWDLSDPAVVSLRIRVDSPRFLFSAIDGALGFDSIDRTVNVRVEQEQ